MRKIVITLLTFALLAVAISFAFAGYRNHRLFVLSLGNSEALIRLDNLGTFAVMVDPPGRSLFRPGGVLEIFVTREGIPIEVEKVRLGGGSLRVTDLMGHVCMEQQLDKLAVTYSGRGQHYSVMGEFETNGGGPYRVAFEVTEPFRGLEGTLQILSARHFVSGGEVALHYFQYGMAGLSGGLFVFLIRRSSTAKGTKIDVTLKKS